MRQSPLAQPRSPRACQRQWRHDAAVLHFVIAGAIVLSLCTLVYVLGQESAQAVRSFDSLA